MKLKALMACGVVAVAVPVSVAVAAPSPYKITGGGQTFAEGSYDPATGKPTVKGPGDTIAFQAFINESETNDTTATGQINVIDRSGGTGHFKGVVDCAFVSVADANKGGGYAELRGHDRNDAGRFFRVRIVDDGQGKDTLDMVQYTLDFDDDENTDGDQQGECADFDPADESNALARGNAKIHKQSPNQSGKSKSAQQKASWTQALTLAGLR